MANVDSGTPGGWSAIEQGDPYGSPAAALQMLLQQLLQQGQGLQSQDTAQSADRMKQVQGTPGIGSILGGGAGGSSGSAGLG